MNRKISSALKSQSFLADLQLRMKNILKKHPHAQQVCNFLSRPTFFAALVTFIYFCFNLILVLNHEPWRDEANPWQIAKNLSFENFFDIMRVEPHPALWYLILMPFAKLGFPYVTTNLISLFIMTSAVFLTLRFSPFSRLSKLLIVLSSAFLYFNPVISRNYCLIVLFSVLVAIIYPARLKHPLLFLAALALLAQSHFLAYGLIAALFILFLIDCVRTRLPKKLLLPYLIGVFLLTLSFASSLPMIIGSLNDHSIINESQLYGYESIGQVLEELNLALFGTGFPIFEISAAAIIILLFIHSRRLLFCLMAAEGFLIFTLATIYSTGAFPAQKCSIIILFLIIVSWLSYSENKLCIKETNFFFKHLELVKLCSVLPVSVVLLVPVFCSIPQTFASALNDIQNDYSYSYQLADYLNKNTPESSVILVANSTSAGISVTFVPLLQGNRQFYDVAEQDFIQYYQYDGYPDLDLAAIKQVVSIFAEDRPIYYLAPQITSCNASKVPLDTSWTPVLELTQHPESFESDLILYQVSTPELPSITKQSDAQLAAEIFSVDSIPQFYIDIQDFDTSYGVWNDGMSLEVEDEIVDAFNHYGTMSGEIRTRGNTTYEAGEKYGPYQYKIKLDEAVDLLGMGSHRKWVLLANFLDRSYLRQFYLSGVGQLIMGEDYFSPQMKYIELYINGDYQGLYLLVESIEEDEERLNIEQDVPESQAEIPFLVQMENGRMPRSQGNWYDHDTFFMIDDQAVPCIDYEWLESPTTDTMISLEYPGSSQDMTTPQYDFLRQEVSDLYSETRNHIDFKDLDIDVASFVNYFAFHDLMFNTGFGSSSIYFYRPLHGKMTAGPLWDFDQLLMMDIGYGFTRPSTCDNNLYRYLLAYPEFRELLKEKLQWIDEVLNPIIYEQLDALQNNTTLRSAVMRNEAKYHTWGTYYPDLSVYQHPQIVSYTSWDQHIDHIRQALFTGYQDNSSQVISRARWMLDHFEDLK